MKRKVDQILVVVDRFSKRWWVFHLKTRRMSTKLDSLKVESFTVEKKLEFDNYKLRLPDSMRIHSVFHLSRLQKTENPETNEDIQVTGEEYDVEKIIDKRIRKGVTKYLVRWVECDQSEDTWEPTRHLNYPEKVREFQNHRGQRDQSRDPDPKNEDVSSDQ
jgi:Chromo (CHRromatin Organisation MOdifier) domain